MNCGFKGRITTCKFSLLNEPVKLGENLYVDRD